MTEDTILWKTSENPMPSTLPKEARGKQWVRRRASPTLHSPHRTHLQYSGRPYPVKLEADAKFVMALSQSSNPQVSSLTVVNSRTSSRQTPLTITKVPMLTEQSAGSQSFEPPLFSRHKRPGLESRMNREVWVPGSGANRPPSTQEQSRNRAAAYARHRWPAEVPGGALDDVGSSGGSRRSKHSMMTAPPCVSRQLRHQPFAPAMRPSRGG